MVSEADVVFNGSLDEVEEYFHRRLWTDGLPVIPPTRDRVERFLAQTRRDPDVSLGSLAPSLREATVRSVAINGVMAGCRPEYMPLLIAIVETMADPRFRIQDAGSTPGWEPLVIVSGPIVQRLDFNVETGVLKVGRQANASIGRFARLYMRNVAGILTPPGMTDKSCIGMTFLVSLAENEAFVKQLGWPTFGQDRGFSPDEDVVTVQSIVTPSMPTYSAGEDPRNHAALITEVIARGTWAYWAWCGLWYGAFHPLLVLAPGIASVFAKGGWSKRDIRQYIWSQAKLPASAFVRYAHNTGPTEFSFERMAADGRVPASWWDPAEPDRPIPLMVAPDDIGILVAGDTGRNQSRGYVPNHAQGAPVSRRIDAPSPSGG